MRGIDCRYPKIPIRIPIVHLETLDGHRESQVFSGAHVCESTVGYSSPDAYELMSKKIRGGYDFVGLADLGEKPQTSLSEFCIEVRPRKHLLSHR